MNLMEWLGLGVGIKRHKIWSVFKGGLRRKLPERCRPRIQKQNNMEEIRKKNESFLEFVEVEISLLLLNWSSQKNLVSLSQQLAYPLFCLLFTWLYRVNCQEPADFLVGVDFLKRLFFVLLFWTMKFLGGEHCRRLIIFVGHFFGPISLLFFFFYEFILRSLILR